MSRLAPGARGRGALARWALGGLAVAGTADVAQFLLTNLGMGGGTPGRAAGSVLGVAVWAGLLGCAVSSLRGGESTALRRTTVGLAALAAVGGVGLAAVHASAHVGGLRPGVTGALGVGALALSLAAGHR
ncbi:MAG TPA: hypothetical protein VMW47_02695 [Verrucomicrobiae bacterium]|nr:hypothetical protein [Verrucomicrobiae bacterium]